jgi:hypothetical protein
MEKLILEKFGQGYELGADELVHQHTEQDTLGSDKEDDKKQMIQLIR